MEQNMNCKTDCLLTMAWVRIMKKSN